jgi:ferritin-like metal-binding protein YciE
MTSNDMIVTWLKDAYAMEQAIVPVLENQVKLTEDHPEIQSGIQRHLEATREHAETVKTCLETLGESPSGLKSGMAKAGGFMQGLMGSLPQDNLVKGALQDYSTEHMEIASYKALIVAAQDAGLTNVVSACEGILRDEEQMASWLDQNLPTIVRTTFAKAAA